MSIQETVDRAALAQGGQIEAELITRRAVSLEAFSSAEMERECLRRALARTKKTIEQMQAGLVNLVAKSERQRLELMRQQEEQ